MKNSRARQGGRATAVRLCFFQWFSAAASGASLPNPKLYLRWSMGRIKIFAISGVHNSYHFLT